MLNIFRSHCLPALSQPDTYISPLIHRPFGRYHTAILGNNMSYIQTAYSPEFCHLPPYTKKNTTWIYPPPRMPVTSRIITCLLGNPYKPLFTTVTGWRVDPKHHIYQKIMTTLDLRVKTVFFLISSIPPNLR